MNDDCNGLVRPPQVFVRKYGVSVCAAIIFLFGGAIAEASPVWIMSNGFHTSLVFRKSDLPDACEISSDPRANFLVIGWGAGDFYRGQTNPWTFLKAVFGLDRGLLHVVPVSVPLTRRFPHSDLVEIDVSPSNLQKLSREMDRAFLQNQAGHKIFSGRGYYADSRFYLARERFYFPYMCNTWVALKLRRSGVPVFVPTAITADGLLRQVAAHGIVRQRRGKPRDAF